MTGEDLGALKPARCALAWDEWGDWKPSLLRTVGQVFELDDVPTGDHRWSHGPGNLEMGWVRAALMCNLWFPRGKVGSGWDSGAWQ